ncbi:hypothetical protein [Streptomyces gobiensis]|uniref:hypothetical protein n=1 Tax=Streptomyces gobiensis TaxID=2875706 RepID=UPI001E5E693F|nr:hypothetical protein [Streptomyces gobiensis]UGY93034.1 hypothetical protein test1122_15805 [Streptomyces gobiensis]
MTRQGSANAMVERLVAIDWTDWDTADDHAVSRSMLLREYLRRAALWVQELGGTDEWPFFDIAERIDPSVPSDQELIDRLEKFTSENVPGLTTRKMCRAAVNWAALQEVAHPRLGELDDPYEPLVMLYARGGGFTVENGVADFLFVPVPLGTWQEHVAEKPVVALDPAMLDALDAESSN